MRVRRQLTSHRIIEINTHIQHSRVSGRTQFHSIADACLEISRDVADEFLALLSGGLRSARTLLEQMSSKSKKKQSQAAADRG